MDQQTDIYAKAATELASIDEQIASLEKRRVTLRQFVELGKQLFGATASEPRPQAGPPTSRRILLYGPGAREASMKARILSLSREAIEQRGPTHTRDLVAYIEAAGVEITGSDKNTTVSVVLSRSTDFKSDRSSGWSLVQKETPQDAPTSAGSSAA